jgi:hypothetical protein
MERASMVHALEEIHRLLKPDGRLIDIHPDIAAQQIEIYQGRRLLFVESIQWAADDREVIRLADEALVQIVRRGLFDLERSGEFDLRTYGSSAAELRDQLSKPSGVHTTSRDEAEAASEAGLFARVEAFMQTAGDGAEIAIHERARIKRLRPIR